MPWHDLMVLLLLCRFDFHNMQANACSWWICEQICRAKGIGAQLHITWVILILLRCKPFYSGMEYFCVFSRMIVM
jgi:hypothetical protein